MARFYDGVDAPVDGIDVPKWEVLNTTYRLSSVKGRGLLTLLELPMRGAKASKEKTARPGLFYCLQMMRAPDDGPGEVFAFTKPRCSL